MAKRFQSRSKKHSVPLVNGSGALTLQQVKLLIVETGDNSELSLRLRPSQGVQAFVVLLKQTLPTIR